MSDGKLTNMYNTRITVAGGGIDVQAIVQSFHELWTTEMQHARGWGGLEFSITRLFGATVNQETLEDAAS
jgi:hypothetical protein